MTRGVGYTKHLDDTLKKSIYATQVPNKDFLYRVSSTKETEYDVGNRVVTPDGRVYRYALASAACTSNTGCASATTKVGNFEHFNAANSIGDNSFEIDNTRSSTYTLDQLHGGYALIHNADNSVMKSVGIVGNDVTDTDGNTVIYMDTTFQNVTTVSFRADLFASPYSSMSSVANNHRSVLGVPQAAAVSGEYFWLQTWGPTYISHGDAGMGAAAEQRQYVFGANWALFPHNAAKATTQHCQHAGFIIHDTSAGNSPPFMMLQISP